MVLHGVGNGSFLLTDYPLTFWCSFATVPFYRKQLVADPYRAGGKQEAAEYFENGMLEACRNMYICSREDIPVTIYYAFKQSDGDQYSDISTGWEKLCFRQ